MGQELLAFAISGREDGVSIRSGHHLISSLSLREMTSLENAAQKPHVNPTLRRRRGRKGTNLHAWNGAAAASRAL